MKENPQAEPADDKRNNFIETIIEEDLKNGKNGGAIQTRFPPEPNGYLHIGHAKSIVLNFTMARKFGGKCNLRFDDTNPVKEEERYVQSIQEDVRWLGFEWDGPVRYASDYFEELYQFALRLIQADKAYVCELTAEQVSEYRGVPTRPGKPSPWRDRPIAESLEIFHKMRKGHYPEGQYLLRAKIDMASPNMHMRDPILYRIRHAEHHRTGSEWCIYPMYDFAHGQGDYFEGVTHSLCTLEFEVHRPLYDWFLDNLAEPGRPRPQQIEFARLNMSYTVMSKRKLLELVETKVVTGWDDPRMPTLSGMRNRGYPPEAIRAFVERIGVARRENVIDLSLLEFFVREHLNKTAPRYMAVLHPLKVVLTNYPPTQAHIYPAILNPEDPSAGERLLDFSRELYIDRDDFMENPPKDYFRLAPGAEVRLRYGYYITCQEVVKDAEGNVVELRCTYDPDSFGGTTADGRKVKGTIQWVNAKRARPATIRLFDRLFNDPTPDGHKDRDFKEFLNPDSLKYLHNCLVEPAVAKLPRFTHFQLERVGYFFTTASHRADEIHLDRTSTLRDSWAKQKKS